MELGEERKAISPDLFGIFFEDLSYAADGGLYAELVQNRSFEYSSRDRKEWNGLTAWTSLSPAEDRVSMEVTDRDPLNQKNPHSLIVRMPLATTEHPAMLSNAGFGGMNVKAGESYDFSAFVRQVSGDPTSVSVWLENGAGRILATTTLRAPTSMWSRRMGTLVPDTSAADARLVLQFKRAGSVALDVVSLFPRHTFHDRPNGVRADLAEAIASIHPHFMRFPGGCLVHGDGLSNMYRWQETIGPVESRLEQPNIWNYHQSVGLGYFEYFQFAEDIGAKPLPVVSAGVSCQNTGAGAMHKYGIGQEAIPLDLMDPYIQDVLDLIEFANGPASSSWGAKRAAMGHPAPFRLQYIGIGNEDKQTDAFRERFRLISNAVRAKYPQVTVVGTVGPAPEGEDYTLGWKFASDAHVPVVDEHMYKTPAWFFENMTRYDSYSRSGPRVYIGEYAAHDSKRQSTVRAALAEAAFMTSLERNGDIVQMASYAPLLDKLGHSSWDPSLIYFDDQSVFPTVSYQVQKLFSSNAGDLYIPFQLLNRTVLPRHVAISAVENSASHALIVKIVNDTDVPQPMSIRPPHAYAGKHNATLTTLTGNPDATNAPGMKSPILPFTASQRVNGAIGLSLTAHSLTVLRVERAN